MMMHKPEELQLVLKVLDDSTDQLVTEMIKAAQSNSTSRMVSYAPNLVSLAWCRDVIENKLTAAKETADQNQKKVK
jgi:hypothetical protein